jgi:hypothetical protein
VRSKFTILLSLASRRSDGTRNLKLLQLQIINDIELTLELIVQIASRDALALRGSDRRIQ